MSFAWVLPLVFAAVVIVRVSGGRVKYPLALTSAKLAEMYDSIQGKSVGERIAYWSENIHANPTLLQPLGSGPAVNDSAPLFARGYDCTTFVETVGALARSSGGEQLADQLVAIRYRNGIVSYETRNHFPEADWIPNNESAGVLRDITVQVARKAGFVASFVHKEIDKLAWFKTQGNTSANRLVATNAAGTVNVQLPYIPVDKIMTSLQHIPQGAIVNVVRESQDRHPVVISHQGFLVWKGGVAYFRHASRDKVIRETRFENYLRQSSGMPWKVIGFNVNTFQG